MSRIIALVGPTASGKSQIAIGLAERLDGHIVSVDSMQVYRGMDIGTAKPSAAERARIAHHLIDVADPMDDFTVSQFQKQGRAVLDGLADSGTTAIVTGGSGLHMRAILDPLTFPPTDRAVRAAIDGLDREEARRRLEEIDPGADQVLDLANPRRVQRALEIYELTGSTPSVRADSPQATMVRAYQPHYPFAAVGVDAGGATAVRIKARLESMFEEGLVAEVTGLNGHLGRNAGQAVGYKQLLPFVHGKVPLESATEEALRATMALAKRQRTFFRRDPRIHWVEWHELASARLGSVLEFLREDPS